MCKHKQVSVMYVGAYHWIVLDNINAFTLAVSGSLQSN